MQTENAHQEALQLQPWNNPAPHRAYVIEMQVQTFLCLCPLSGAPDYARLWLDSIPYQAIVALKSLKLSFDSFRQMALGHEAVINRFLDDVVPFLNPRWMRTTGAFAVRGGMLVMVEADCCLPDSAGPRFPKRKGGGTLKQKSTLDERGGAQEERKPRTKAMVLLSGGLDSGVLSSLLGLPSQEARIYRQFLGFDSDPYDLHCLSLLYGQRHQRELDAAATLAQALSARHTLLDLSALRPLLAGSALTERNVEVPFGHSAAPTMQLMVVPNRNALLLSIACALDVAEQAEVVAAGMHAGDHPVYPDCRPAFVQAFQAMKEVATEGYAVPGLKVVAPFVNLRKEYIVQLGAHLHVSMEQTWSCYKGEDLHCGHCGTCVERREAFALAHIPDTPVYQETIEPVGKEGENQWMKACCSG